MPTQCVSEQFRFEGFDGRRIEAACDGGAVTSDAGALLLREADRAIGLIDRVAACFRDGRDPGRVVHVLRTLIGQRIIGLALDYEDVADHDDLRFDPILALFSDRLEAGRPDCAPLGGKSTLSRLEHAPRDSADRYRKIAVDAGAVESLLVNLFLDALARAPREIVLNLDATDVKLPRFSLNPQTKCDTGYVRDRHGNEIQPPRSGGEMPFAQLDGDGFQRR